MSVTEREVTQQQRPTESVPGSAPVGDTWFDTGDHKRVGLLYVYSAIAFLVVGGLAAGAMRAELASAGDGLSIGDYSGLFSMHATTMVMLFLAPLWVGVATYIVPLQIGTTRLAFPRAQALSFWLYLVGGVLLLASYVFGPPRGGGITLERALEAPSGGADGPTQLWIASLAVLAVSALVAAVTLLVTICTRRVEGMTFLRMPAFTWSIFGTSVGVLLATPVFLAGLALLHLDQRFGGTLFAADDARGSLVWLHMLWLYGRPEIFLLALPGLGVACEVYAVAARRPLLSATAAAAGLMAFAILSFTAWMGDTSVDTALVQPHNSLATLLTLAPVGLLVLLWMGTFARGRPRFTLPAAFVASAVLLWGLGALNALVAGLVGVDRPISGSAWTYAQLNTVAFTAPTLLAFGAVYHWAPKLFGRKLNQGLGGLHLLLVLGGTLGTNVVLAILGYRNMPGRVAGYDDGFQLLNLLASLASAATVLGFLVFLVNLVLGRRRARDATTADDPWDGHTLEWATSSPPPRHNFDTVPEVRSAAPLHDLRRATAASTNGSSAGSTALDRKVS